MRKKKNAFTLIELLAVIVILAVILVIAIPRILDVIETSKKDSFKNAVQLIADSAEKKKVSDKLLGKDEEITCKGVAKINDEDYKSCIISFDSEGNAKVSITGKGKFDGLKITNGTKENAEVKEITKPTYRMKATEYITNLLEYDGEGLKKDNTPDQNIRYYGSNPDNYVSFNNELWRIIGVFGNNVKLVRSEKLGELSWDSSESSINSGWGVNEWSQADLKNYLNTMYYGGTSVTCYTGKNNQTKICPTGTIDETSKGLIDYYTWNTGAPNYNKLYNSTTELFDTVEFYNAERGSVNGKICSSGTGCNDTVERTTTWTGYVGLPYITDYAYASSESDCNTKIDQSSSYKCKNNNWMFKPNKGYWTLSPRAFTSNAHNVWRVRGDGGAGSDFASLPNAVFPAIYLKSNILIESGKGTSSNPYMLKLNS
jgi:prepilin-type N-terminal cleavage/methylation domain-containing protein